MSAINTSSDKHLIMDRPIITSILDEDKYNFHMGNFFFHRYFNSIVRYSYKCRDVGIDFTPIYKDIQEQIMMLGELKLTTNECDWMLKNTLCSEQYVEFLHKTTILDPKSVDMKLFGTGGISIEYGGNPHLEILREVKLLAIISELYFRNIYKENYDAVAASTQEWIDQQIQWLASNGHPKFNFFEAGGRRRFSFDRHEQVLTGLWNGLKDVDGTPKYIMGTSNCLLGMKHNIPTFGTQAHQLYMFMQTVTHPALSMTRAMDEWLKFYQGKLAIALTDTLGDKKWDRDFTRKYMEAHDGQRQDSGNPRTWGELRLDAYKRDQVDPMKKSFTFGDSLNWVKANDLTAHFDGRIGTVNSLIGTFITNTLGEKFPNHKPLSQVAKMMWANGLPCGKLGSDMDSGKNQCEDGDAFAFLKSVAIKY